MDHDNSEHRQLGLDHALSGLAGLVSGTQSLEQLLTAVATLATSAIPGADGAGVTMAEGGRPDLVVASAPFVSEVDTIQYRLGEGPCISAVSSSLTTTSGALGNDPEWPRFGPLADALGVSSVVSFPLTLDGDNVGSLNVYAFASEAFPASSIRIGEQFADPATVVIVNAHRFDEARRLTQQLEGALVNRAIIDQAIGIIRSRSGSTSDEAFTRLRILSQRSKTKLAIVAAGIVDEAVARARARAVTEA